MTVIQSKQHTVASTLHVVRALGLSIRRENGEYRIMLPGRPETSYYTTDPVDAIGTALAMKRGA